MGHRPPAGRRRAGRDLTSRQSPGAVIRDSDERGRGREAPGRVRGAGAHRAPPCFRVTKSRVTVLPSSSVSRDPRRFQYALTSERCGYPEVFHAAVSTPLALKHTLTTSQFAGVDSPGKILGILLGRPAGAISILETQQGKSRAALDAHSPAGDHWINLWRAPRAQGLGGVGSILPRPGTRKDELILPRCSGSMSSPDVRYLPRLYPLCLGR